MGIPAKRHRRRLKVYDDCFTGRKAVDWMHNYLMFSSYFSRHEVSRFQALQLLRKFAHHSIIQRVDGGGSRSDLLTQEFKDNRDLWSLSPSVASMLPINQPIPDDQEICGDNSDDLNMDLEAEPVPTSSSSSMPSIPSSAASSSSSFRSQLASIAHIRKSALVTSTSLPSTSASAAGCGAGHGLIPTPLPLTSLNCCSSRTACHSISGITPRSPLKPVNRSNSSATLAAVVRVRRIPDDVFWL